MADCDLPSLRTLTEHTSDALRLALACGRVAYVVECRLHGVVQGRLCVGGADPMSADDLLGALQASLERQARRKAAEMSDTDRSYSQVEAARLITVLRAGAEIEGTRIGPDHYLLTLPLTKAEADEMAGILGFERIGDDGEPLPVEVPGSDGAAMQPAPRQPTFMDNPPACGAPKNWKWGYLPCGCSNDGFGQHRR